MIFAYLRRKTKAKPFWWPLILILWVFTKIGDSVLWALKVLATLVAGLPWVATGLLTLWRFLFTQFISRLRFLWFFSKIRLTLPALKIPWPSREPKPPRRGRPPKIRGEIIFFKPFSLKIRWYAFGFLTAFFLLFLPTLFYSWLKDLPNPHLLQSRQIPQTTKIFDRNGKLLYEIYAEQNRTLVPLSQIPDHLKKATIATEDKDFYHHQGFNLLSIARAARENLFNHQLQGGSTITQQLVKSALLTPEVTFNRKIKEAFLAFWAERIYTKDQILEMYLNQVPYGGTAWGVEAASVTYFGKSAKDLTLSESALLAGLPAAPTTYSPFGARPELAKTRQTEVLKRMVEDGYASREQATEIQNQELSFAPQKTNIRAPHFVMSVKELLGKKYGERLVEQGGLQVTTTLDLEIQEEVQSLLTQEILSLVSFLVGNGAALVVSPKTGEILAMVGSRDYFDTKNDGNVNVTLSPRQPGSAIKVVTYSSALQNGFTASTILDDSPITYQVPGSLPYSPVNYDGRFHGKVPLRSALGNSYNVPAVKTLAQIGVEKMISQGQKMGITTWEDKSRFGLSLTLGGGEVTLYDLAQVYGVLATMGKKVSLNPILEVKDFKGEVLETLTPKEEEVLPAGVAFILADILADNAARTAAFGPNSALVIPGKTVAVKTGTTNDKRDNWTIGFTPSILVGVWVGNNNNAPMHPTLASGVTGAAPLWQKIMSRLLKDKENESFQKPEEVVEAKVCPLWGREKEYFLKGTEPKAIFCPQITPTPTPSS